MSWRDSAGHVRADVWQQYWDGTLAQHDAELVAAHARACPVCQEESEQWQRLFALITSTPDEAPPAEAAAAGRAAVLGRIRRQRRWRGLRGWLAAAVSVPVLYAAALQAGAVWDALAARFPALGPAQSGVELTGLFVKSVVRLLLWFGGMPTALAVGVVTSVVLANMVVLRVVTDVFDRKLFGGMHV